VVTEPRLYPKWTPDAGAKSASVCNIRTGITAAKKAINNLHDELGKSGFEQVAVVYLTLPYLALPCLTLPYLTCGVDACTRQTPSA